MITDIILDIEGTTTPVDFVYGVLFPYARTHMAGFLAKNFDAQDREWLLAEYEHDSDRTKPSWAEPPLEYLLWLMDVDRKSHGLKSIQGKIWERGFLGESLRGVVYPDVPIAFQRWKKLGKRLFIYSSGSVQAQRLLFKHSTEGDLTIHLDGYFDTEIGPKKEAASYRNIAHKIAADPAQCLFVSDIAAECEAAKTAGFSVLLAIRPKNAPQEGVFTSIDNFDEIDPYL